MRKISITALIYTLEGTNEKANWKVKLHSCFQRSGLNFSLEKV